MRKSFQVRAPREDGSEVRGQDPRGVRDGAEGGVRERVQGGLQRRGEHTYMTSKLGGGILKSRELA